MSTPHEYAFYKIIFNPDLKRDDILCTCNPSIIGRSETKLSQETLNFIGISNQRWISRELVKLEWNATEKIWHLYVLTKSGVYSRGIWYSQNECIRLSNNEPTPIQFGLNSAKKKDKNKSMQCYFCPMATCTPSLIN